MSWRWPWQKAPKPAPRPPKVGGTRAPDNVLAIDFSKPHDFHFNMGSAYGQGGTTPKVFKQCLLVGFTQPIEPEEPGFREFAHTRWLVLKQPDGRIAYVPRDNLIFIEESVASTA